MRATPRPPALLGALAALLAAALGAAPAAHHQAFIVCKPSSSRLCVVWPRQSADIQFAQGNGHWCGLAAGPPTPHHFHTVRALDNEGAAVPTTIYCDVVLMGGMRRQRARRQVAPTPRGRFRGQTQSQYLAIERGGADEGKAEAHSAADSSRASVSGNSGMGQAQSQSMYDPSCDDCYGKAAYGSNDKSNSGYGPSRTNGLTWDGPSGIGRPVGNKHISSSPIGSYGPLQPGIQENQYYSVPGRNNFGPGGVAGVSPEGNKNYRPNQGGMSQEPTTGQGGSPQPFSGRGPSVAAYDPRQQEYGGYAAVQPPARPEQNNNLGNRYGPSQGSVTGNYGPGMDRSPGGASYAPGSLINPPSRGLDPGHLGGTTSNLQPNPIGSQENYNQMKPVGIGYHRGEITVPGAYKPGQNGVFGPGFESNLPYGTSKNIIPNGGGPQVNSGVYNPNQAGLPGGLYNLNQAGTPSGIYNPNQPGTPSFVYNPNQAGTPGGVYNPSKATTPDNLYNPNQAGTPGGVYNPSKATIPGNLYNPNQPGTSGAVYNTNQGSTPGGVYNSNQDGIPGGVYNLNQAGTQPRGVYNTNQASTPGSVYNPKQAGSTGELGGNIHPQGNTNANHGSVPISGGNWPLASYNPGNSPYFCCVVGPDGNLMAAKGSPYDNGHGIIKQYPSNNMYERPVFSSESSGSQNGPGYVFGQNNFKPGHQEGYGSMGPNHDTSANNYGHRAGGTNGNGNYRPPANIASLPGSEVSFTPGGSGPVGNGNYLSPNLDHSRDGRGYSPAQNVGRNDINLKPGVATGGSPGGSSGYPLHQNGATGIGNYAPNQGKADSYVPGQIGPANNAGIGGDVTTNTGRSYGPTTNTGQSIDPNFNPVPPGSTGFKPDLNGHSGGSFHPQQIGSTGSNTGYEANPQDGVGGMGNYNLGQNPAGVQNYFPGLTSSQRGSYGPRPNSPNNFGSKPSGEPGNIQSYGSVPISSGYGPVQNGNSNILESGNINPNHDGLGATYNPNEGFHPAEKSPYGPGQDVMGQAGSYPQGVDGRQPMHGTELFNKYGRTPVENGYDQRFMGQNNEYNGVPQNFTDPSTIADGDDSEAEASVSQSANGTTASASSRGGNDKGRAQTNVHGTYIGSGSFSAQAQITGENKEAESEVSGGKKGASSSAQGSGRNNKSQANVQLGSETGSVQTQSLTNGAYHSSNSQVQGSIKGGMADAQARGPGSTSSQAQIGFTPYKDGDKAHDMQKIPFVGGGMASAQSSGRTGQSQSQLHGTFKYGITYNGAAQAGGSVDKDAVFPNRLAFDKIDVFDENDKNINVETEKPMDQSSDTTPPLESVPSEESLPPNNIPQLSNLLPAATDDETTKEEETLKNSESRYSSHTHLDHHKTTGQASPPTPVGGATRSFPSAYSNNGAEYEYTTDREDIQPDEYDTDGAEVEQGEYSNYDDIRDTLTHQSLQSPRKPLEVKQTTGGNTQHIVLDSLDNHDAEITQRNSERPDEKKTYQPGETIPGTGGYTIPAGFTGSVKSVASKENTYVVGSKESPSQAQTVTLTPGTGKVKYSFPRTVSAGKLRSLHPRPRDDRYVSVSKSVARDLDAEDHVRKQYSHSYYTKSSSCGFFTFTCTMVSGAEGRKKVCRPKIPTNPDGTPIRC